MLLLESRYDLAVQDVDRVCVELVPLVELAFDFSDGRSASAATKSFRSRHW